MQGLNLHFSIFTSTCSANLHNVWINYTKLIFTKKICFHYHYNHKNNFKFRPNSFPNSKLISDLPPLLPPFHKLLNSVQKEPFYHYSYK